MSTHSINIGRSLSVMHFNIEGSSAENSEILSRVAYEHCVDVIALQETHIDDAVAYNIRGHIPGYNTVAYLTHSKYGIATYIRVDHLNYSVILLNQENDISCIVVEVNGVKITNVYKPPNILWPDEVLKLQSHPAVYVGDYNSHHIMWGYTRNNENGAKLLDWAESSNLFLVQDLKGLTTFKSARWQSGTNPDLCFVSIDKNGNPF